MHNQRLKNAFQQVLKKKTHRKGQKFKCSVPGIAPRFGAEEDHQQEDLELADSKEHQAKEDLYRMSFYDMNQKSHPSGELSGWNETQNSYSNSSQPNILRPPEVSSHFCAKNWS